MPPNIQLENNDVAIVMRADGKLMLYVPIQDDSAPLPYNVLVGTAIARALAKDSPHIQTLIKEVAADIEQASTPTGRVQ